MFVLVLRPDLTQPRQASDLLAKGGLELLILRPLLPELRDHKHAGLTSSGPLYIVYKRCVQARRGGAVEEHLPLSQRTQVAHNCLSLQLQGDLLPLAFASTCAHVRSLTQDH